MTTPTSTAKAAGAKETNANASRATDAQKSDDRNGLVGIGLKVVDTAKKAANRSLDAYEKTLDSSLDYHTTIAAASNVEWVSTIAAAQAKLTREFSSASTAAVRELLK